MQKLVYCEHGATTKSIRAAAKNAGAKLIYFPYDPDSKSRRLAPTATPSQAQFQDANISFAEAKFGFDAFAGSPLYSAILSIVGAENRRDALHVDSAYKSGCVALVSCDSDLLTKRHLLQAVVSFPILHPDNDLHELIALLSVPDAV